ncbi:MAG: hypothetical protein O7F11_00420 [Acidobacteria bacterium]|nr:hypothetical protein [Acidobacteriota bacterium]
MKARLKTTRQQKTRNRLFLNGRRAALVVAGLVIGFGLALPQDSLAGNKHRHHIVKVHVGHGHHAYRRAVASPYAVQRRGYVRAGHFTVPRQIVVRAERDRYRSYYNRRVYYAPHRHYHQVYDFPVYYQERRVPRPYAYCNGNLYGGLHLSYSRPGFSVAVGW